MEEEDYNYDDNDQNLCEDHYQFNCPICFGEAAYNEEQDLENIMHEAKGKYKFKKKMKLAILKNAQNYLKLQY